MAEVKGIRVYYEKDGCLFDNEISQSLVIKAVSAYIQKQLSDSDIPFILKRLVLPAENIMDGVAIQVNEKDKSVLEPILMDWKKLI